ncbi:hypothetical protein OAL10_12840, partial [Gammaproteobacteria bacterium]|nr:hypothetical protein [Gammaproteobacteria bacterium]
NRICWTPRTLEFALASLILEASIRTALVDIGSVKGNLAAATTDYMGRLLVGAWVLVSRASRCK